MKQKQLFSFSQNLKDKPVSYCFLPILPPEVKTIFQDISSSKCHKNILNPFLKSLGLCYYDKNFLMPIGHFRSTYDDKLFKCWKFSSPLIIFNQYWDGNNMAGTRPIIQNFFSSTTIIRIHFSKNVWSDCDY